ncbi:hypothetical protein DINM_001691 [Dirofilaria immitis]|nr:hypothetical protein [Dirofilaria immitis]
MSKNGYSKIHEQCWEPTSSLEDIRKCIRNGHYIMVIMRGIPGSGKSYLASNLVSGTNGAVFNTDKYFMQSGVYQFDPTKLDEYHQKNWNEAKDAMRHGIKPIIIDNTNIFVAHMKPYITLAVKNLYEIYFVEPETEWKKMRNAHSVPEEKIAYMVECFEKVNLIDVIKPTQLRVIPPLIDISDNDDTFNLLLSKLDFSVSVSEYPEDIRKANTVEEEVEEAAPLPSSNSECSLYKSADLLKTSSISKKSFRNVGCQTSDLIRILNLSDSLPSVNDEFFWRTIRDDTDLGYKKKMRGKVVQAGDGNILPDIELLLRLFPDEKPSDVLHILEIVGLNNALTLLKEMNAHLNVYAPAGKNKNVKAEPLSKTYYWWDEAEFERINNNGSPMFMSNLEMNAAIPEKLPPCTYRQCPDPEPVPEGYYRMEISVDMMQQLTQLFVTNGFESESFDFSSFKNPDEELARILQNHELASDESLENGRHMSIAERLQLNALINHYSGVDRDRIVECFRDNQFSAEATRNTLELFVNGIENVQTAVANRAAIASPVSRPDNCSMLAGFSLSVTKPDLAPVHKDIYELREEADKYNKQKHEMLLRAEHHREIELKCSEIWEKAKDCVAELNERLTKANTSDLFIDLHYMDVQSAIKLLKSKLNAADRPPDLRHGRSGKKLIVLTGYGKLNDGQAKIKPAVIQWLEQCGYDYLDPNQDLRIELWIIGIRFGKHYLCCEPEVLVASCIVQLFW